MKKFLLTIISILIPVFIGYYYYQYYATNGGLGFQCNFHQITGLQCPGCGGQRALNFLVHGKFMDALRCNLLIIIVVPLLSYIYFSLIQFYIFKSSKYLNSKILGEKTGYIFIAILLMFFLLRNIPYEPFIHLTPIS